ncbi:hypothetical protein ACFQZ4_16450 [Catellatospora coxensis]|uniref:Uncharacterized protein n=1 Tax=Catellatospora coxensis TaxID=310354 RepID=A0A8J3KWY9_9ACTN|nr:hypothetical protein [Catellatospora coxensis]GIG07882.1 hypothetical protein Cco03nite_45820 [Catellatospora coxensis]
MARPRTRSLAVMLTALVTTAVAVLVHPAAAHAYPSGSGWSAYWSYNTANVAHLDAKIPGVDLHVFVDDTDSGHRYLTGQVSDTAADGSCARVQIHGTLTGGQIEYTVCGSGLNHLFVDFTSAEPLLFVVQRIPSGSTTVASAADILLPSPATDPGVGAVGTKAGWWYTSSVYYKFVLARSGVEVNGAGTHIPNQNARTVVAQVQNLNSLGCASASLSAGITSTSRQACGTGTAQQLELPIAIGNINVNACWRSSLSLSTRCLTTKIYAPN